MKVNEANNMESSNFRLDLYNTRVSRNVVMILSGE